MITQSFDRTELALQDFHKNILRRGRRFHTTHTDSTQFLGSYSSFCAFSQPYIVSRKSTFGKGIKITQPKISSSLLSEEQVRGLCCHKTETEFCGTCRSITVFMDFELTLPNSTQLCVRLMKHVPAHPYVTINLLTQAITRLHVSVY